jgi:hypothetical protein
MGFRDTGCYSAAKDPENTAVIRLQQATEVTPKLFTTHESKAESKSWYRRLMRLLVGIGTMQP